jgi:hypothetical protein
LLFALSAGSAQNERRSADSAPATAGGRQGAETSRRPFWDSHIEKTSHAEKGDDLPSKRPSENHTTRDHDADAFAGLHYELLNDLNDATWKQEETAKEALAAHPSTFQLMLEVKRLARVLADVCRSHAARCAQIHANCNQENPAQAATKTLSLALCEHLGLPPDTSLLMSELITEPWPEPNRVSEFVLEVAGAPFFPPSATSDWLRRERKLPRWQRKGQESGATFARRPEENTPFLSVEETEKVLRDLEESFRNHLSQRFRIVHATASSAVAALAARARAQKPREYSAPRSKLARAVVDFLTIDELASDQKILTHLREHVLWLIPARWKEEETTTAGGSTCRMGGFGAAEKPLGR